MKSWRYDGPQAVIEEMIARAQDSPEGFAQRTIVASEPHTCDLCGGPLVAWQSYHLTCSVEDGEPQFIRHHIFCPRREDQSNG